MERPRSISLRLRLAALVLLAIMPATALIFYSSLEEQRRAARDAEEALLTVARVAAYEQTLQVAGVRQLLTNLASFPSVRQRETGHCRAVLADLMKPQPHYLNLGAVDLDGNIWCSGRAMTARVNIADRLYFRRAVTSNDFAAGEFQIGRITGKPAINFAFPVHDSTGRITGAVFAALDVIWINQLAARTPLPDGATVVIIDADGTILARVPNQASLVGLPLGDAALRSAIQHGGQQVMSVSTSDGVTHLVAVVPLVSGATGARVAAYLPQAVALADARQALGRDLAILAALTLLVLAVAWYGGDFFVLRRIRTLAAAARQLGNGDLATRTRLPHGDGEIGLLAGSFDTMAESLQERDRHLHDTYREISRVNRALKVLSAGNQSLLRAESEDALLHDICRVVVTAGGYRLTWVGYAEHDQNRSVRPVAIAGLDDGYVSAADVRWSDDERGRGPVGTALRLGVRQVVRNTGTDPAFAPWRAAAQARGFGAVAAFPLRIDNVVTGCLAVYAGDTDAFDEPELELLDELSQDLAYGISVLRARARHREAEAKVERLAYYDTLTGLPNFMHLTERIQAAMKEAIREQRPFALLSVNLDRFKEVNDALGFEQGDIVLAEVAPRLQHALGDDAFIARIHGDTFSVLLANTGTESAESAARRIRAAMRSPFVLNGIPIDVPVTIGIALFPGHGDRPEHLVRRADAAMRNARRHGLGQMYYSSGWEQENPRRLALAGELRLAIENGWLELHYQPKVNIATGCACGVEALARWNHPQLGNVAPDEFIRIAEHTGLIRPLTDWILETAMQQSHAWQLQGIDLPIAVNLSIRNLHDPALLEKVRGLLQAWNIRRGQIEFEVTESAFMEDPERTHQMLVALRESGIAIYIDDFGTGYSSLHYLKVLPVDAIKIDKSFTCDILDDRGSALIVRSTIELAHDLNLLVVAEGVESQPMFDLLRELNCDFAQGYHIARPAPPGMLLDWLERTPWGAAIRSP